MCDPEAKVCAHYLITRRGRGDPAGAGGQARLARGRQSYWRGHKDVNSASIGIELDHPGHDYGYRPFADAQFDALVPLLARIVKEYDIPRANVVGHSDVAPAAQDRSGRTVPVGAAGRIRSVPAAPDKLELGDPFDNDGAFYLALERFGYDITDGHKAVEAFQRRWRPRTDRRRDRRRVCARSCSSCSWIATADG